MSTLIGGRPGCALLARVVFVGDQMPVPGQQRIGGNNSGKEGEAFSPDRFALGRETTALIVGEAGAPAQLLLKNSDFLLEVFDDELLTAIHPASEARGQEGQGIHAVNFDSTRSGGEHFFRNR